MGSEVRACESACVCLFVCQSAICLGRLDYAWLVSASPSLSTLEGFQKHSSRHNFTSVFRTLGIFGKKSALVGSCYCTALKLKTESGNPRHRNHYRFREQEQLPGSASRFIQVFRTKAPRWPVKVIFDIDFRFSTEVRGLDGLVYKK